jgi:hypothetical protein
MMRCACGGELGPSFRTSADTPSYATCKECGNSMMTGFGVGTMIFVTKPDKCSCGGDFKQWARTAANVPITRYCDTCGRKQLMHQPQPYWTDID